MVAQKTPRIGDATIRLDERENGAGANPRQVGKLWHKSFWKKKKGGPLLFFFSSRAVWCVSLLILLFIISPLRETPAPESHLPKWRGRMSLIRL